jgi:hypothetical protein
MRSMSVLMGGGTERSLCWLLVFLPVLTCLLPAILPRLSGVVGLHACAPYGRRMIAQRGLLLRAPLVVRIANVLFTSSLPCCCRVSLLIQRLQVRAES